VNFPFTCWTANRERLQRIFDAFVLLWNPDRTKRGRNMLNLSIRGLVLAMLAVLALPLAMPAHADDAATDPAAKQIQTFYDVLLDNMKRGKELSLMGRYNKLKPVIEQTYDLPLMTSLAVGPTWSSLPATDQQALIAAFERMTLANYAKNFDTFSGEKFVVDPNAQVHGTDKVVMSKLITSGQTIPFNYRMRQSNGSWKVIDVYLNGFVSELATRRSDFAATLSSGGAQALVKKINELADNAMKG
jgi:phospholipid transport system substrate-binding protein